VLRNRIFVYRKSLKEFFFFFFNENPNFQALKKKKKKKKRKEKKEKKKCFKFFLPNRPIFAWNNFLCTKSTF
jgi:hypothetical protein